MHDKYILHVHTLPSVVTIKQFPNLNLVMMAIMDRGQGQWVQLGNGTNQALCH
jgi:hypothetical protein